MKVSPERDTFADCYRAGTPQVVFTRLVGDLETPVSAMLKLATGKPNSFLLESVEGGATRARYSIIGLDPDVIFRAHGDQPGIAESRDGTPSDFHPAQGGTLDALRDLVDASRIDLPHDLPPMAAGVFGYLGYDCIRLVERLPDINPDELDLPDALFLRPRIVVVFDSVRDEITLVTPVRPDPSVSADQAYARAFDRLTETMDALDQPVPRTADPDDAEVALGTVTSNIAPDTYQEMVRKAQDYILAGDIFQVVLSQRFEAKFALPPFALYRALRRVNPAPFLFYLDFGGFAVAGSSPEILVRVRDGRITVRPIAGTRPRGATPSADQALADDLLADPKERAEHLMLLDLGRNDAGRFAKPASVEVTDQFFIEYYSQVMHIVSNVEADLDPAHDAIAALFGGFPAGTVSGAPKIRAMEIIDELEDVKRGIYAGAIGYFAANGDMDSCIVLRTSIVKDGKMYVQAGAGIVADSVPLSEHQECEHKARALFRAGEEAMRFAARSGRGQ
ncbi:MAG: anthranilate synthase component I [Pseudomonadota bacterium]